MNERKLLSQLRKRGEQLRFDLLQIDPNQSMAGTTIAQLLDHLLDELNALQLPGEQNRLPSSEIWQPVADILQHGWLQLRAREKPRGYAGDYELLQRICSRTLCEDRWGHWFDLYFQNQTAPAAVRNRTELAAAAICDQLRKTPQRRCKIVSVGSGPALDVQQACAQLSPAEREQLEVILIDLDPAAITAGFAAVAEYLPPEQIRGERENLFRLPRLTRAKEWLAESDLIICTGIFDYLPHHDATRMLYFFSQSLTAAGRALVFNFSPQNPTRAYMEWIGNWYLIYRDEQEMHQLAAAAEIPAERYRLKAEATGIDLYLYLQK